MATLRLSTRLGLTHGVLAVLLLLLVIGTFQGLVRMLGLISDMRDEHLSSVDAEEELHRSAWAIEVAVRHGQATCARGGDENEVRARIKAARAKLGEVLVKDKDVPPRLTNTTSRYLALADSATGSDTCAVLRAPETDALRAMLDEDLTNAWIDRLQELHDDIEKKEEAARGIGMLTAATGLVIAFIGAVAAVLVTRTTARSVTAPIAELAAGATRLGEGDFTPIPPPQGPLEVEELWKDLERMRLRLLEIEQLKTTFLANVSHELRSPLTRVREGLALLADETVGPLTAPQRRVVSLASRACEREVRIVNALLDMSRLSSGLPLRTEAGGDIDRVLEAITEDERLEANERGVEIEVSAPGSVPGMVIDSPLVERAIANLVRNAVSVSTRGSKVKLERTLVQGSGKVGRAVAIDIIDAGPGLPPDVRNAKFKPFSAASVTGIARPAGIGLGLALAHEVAHAHGGELTVLRSDDSGTTFRFELPLGPQVVVVDATPASKSPAEIAPRRASTETPAST